ncbi:MAG: helix-turn-helix domain-containing protein [Chloroflexota bacterium]|nr:helix-turn-helix domain-containing protein [Chloroflexota bacterium]
MLDTTYHRKRLAQRRLDPQVRLEYDRARRELDQINDVMRALDGLRVDAGMSKADLARAIGRNDAAVRRLFTAEVNPELRTVAAIAAALGAEVRIVPRRKRRRRQSGCESFDDHIHSIRDLGTRSP